jgi:electron transport complex protein RnfG
MSNRQILLSGLFLCLFAVVGTSFVAVTEYNTRQAIAENERRVLLRNLHALLPAEKLDNDIVSDTRLIAASPLLGTVNKSPVYRARLRGEPVAVVFNSIAPNGYSGKIHLLVGVYFDGRVAGVRAVKHAETPGLGDAIEIQKSPWILDFDDKSLDNPARARWSVERDGGEFDQFTGATITPRAVIQAVEKTLLYYEKNADNLFD